MSQILTVSKIPLFVVRCLVECGQLHLQRIFGNELASPDFVL